MQEVTSETNVKNVTAIDQSETAILTAHKYPAWVKFFAFSIAICILYSLTFLPAYIGAARGLKNAEAAYAQGQFQQAAIQYGYVLNAVPSSKKAKIGFAEAVFSNGNPDDFPLGIKALQGITLDTDSWTRLSKVMPSEYQQYFHDVPN